MFNKEEFSRLIQLARGERTNQDYSDECGVSRAYISGYINKRIENPPTPEVIKRLSSKAFNNITYEDLMKAAGHISNIDIINKNENGDIVIIEAMSSHSKLTNKDEKDIEKATEKFLEGLEGGAMLNGEILDDEDFELFKQAVRNGLTYAKISNKKKYTPKKYRKE